MNLLPCPFCGSKVVLLGDVSAAGLTDEDAVCDDCGANASIVAWNSRPSPPSLVEMEGFGVLDVEGELWGGVVGNDKTAFDEAPPDRVVRVAVRVLDASSKAGR